MSPLYAPVEIRPGRREDAGGASDLRNAAIANSTAIWTTRPQTPDEARLWWGQLVDRGAAYVAEYDGAIVGYGCWAPWRPAEGYRFTVEDSVYVATDQKGRGIGRRLLTALVDGARDSGAHVMLADIEATNTGSIALHSRLGFETVGTLREIGTKFDRWLDLTIMRLSLGG